MIATLILIFICSYLAFALSAICGGGAGLILLPILGGLLPVKQVPAALSIGTFTSSASRIVVFYKNINWVIVLWFVPAALPAVWLGAWLLKFVNPMYLEVGMGIFLISNIPFLFKKDKSLEEVKKPQHYVLSLIGFSAGFLSGLTGAVGLLFNKFYLRYGLSKEGIVATRAANELILHLIKIVLYTLFGLITYKVVTVGIVVAAAALLSTFTMKYILPVLSEYLFKKIGYAAMVLSGFVILGQAVNTIFIENKGILYAAPIADGVQAKLQWRHANYALEFAYTDGFEFEQEIPFAELTPKQQSIAKAAQKEGETMQIEAVYGIGSVSYEANYYVGNKLIRDIEFE